MSSSDPGGEPESELDAAADTALREALEAIDGEKTEQVSDATVQKLLTAGARLFAAKVMTEERYFTPFVTDTPSTATATDVVTIVCEMLRQADLNTFDLAMWFNRPRYDE